MNRSHDGSPLAHTYSIVARDPATGELGVAVQSHYFASGADVAWVEANVGAIATQAFAEVGYGPRGLTLLRDGKSAPEALKQLLDVDRHREIRQVAMIDSQGRVAAHTGAETIEAAGHLVGENFSVQGNMLLNDRVWPAMARAFRETAGDLAERMLAALDAAQGEGGDIRGKQAAGLLISSGRPGARPWDRSFDCRVDDSPEPLIELRRLVQRQRAVTKDRMAGRAFARGDFESAFREYDEALALAPDDIEMVYWYAIGLANAGRIEESLPLFRKVFARDRNWATLTERLPRAGMIPNDPALLALILKQRP